MLLVTLTLTAVPPHLARSFLSLALGPVVLVVVLLVVVVVVVVVFVDVLVVVVVVFVDVLVVVFCKAAVFACVPGCSPFGLTSVAGHVWGHAQRRFNN